LIEACILAGLFVVTTIVIALLAAYRGGEGIAERRSTRIGRGLTSFFSAILVPLAGIFVFSAILCPDSDFSGLIICMQKPESAFMLFTTYLALVVFGSYIGGLLCANVTLGFLIGLVAGTTSIPLAVFGLVGHGDVLNLLYGNDVGIYVLLGVIGGAVGGITGMERKRESAARISNRQAEKNTDLRRCQPMGKSSMYSSNGYRELSEP
jgi:uncharacterized membrane protein